MGSRIRENVKHYFECFCEVAGPQPDGTEAWIIQRYPETYRDEQVLKSVPKFTYPCEFDNSTVQHFSFVLTSSDSKWTFGFCRHDPKSETALVVLSYLPWHESFTKFLNIISELTNSASGDELIPFLQSVYQSQIPAPNTSVKFPIRQNGTSFFTCQSPSQFQLPSIPENRNLTEYYNAVDSNNMMIIFASMLYERRIIFTSRRLNRLSACVQSANAIIYPMHWQHIFIPVLPQQLIDYLLAPMPYLIGVSSTLISKVRRNDMGEVVILDADNNTVETPFQDLESLPPDVVKNLRAQLRNRAALLGDGVSRAFLRALVQLIGGYRDALRFHQGEKITFNQDAFVESRPPPMQPFLRKMLELQTFQQFIEERLDMLNAGLGFSDEFEMEACNYSEKSSSRLKQQYREYLSTIRKDTSAMFRSVKSRVKERGKNVGKAYKGIRSKFREGGTREVGGELGGSSVSPTSTTARPRPHTTFITSAATSYRRDLSIKQRLSAGPDSRNQYSPLSPSSPENSSFNLSPLDMDLMGDLQDVIFRNCTNGNTSPAVSPTVDRTLKPVRSLENFHGEGLSYSGGSAVQASAPDLFGASPFTAAPAGEGVDGDSVRLISSADTVRLPPPSSSRPHSKTEEMNLIRLDSLTSVDDFDPLLSKETESAKPPLHRGLSLTNPLYPYYTPQHNDLALLKDYGIDFNSLSLQTTPARTLDCNGTEFNATRSLDFTLTPAPSTQTSQLNWTKFD
ncbi:DENN domain-containing protein 1A-like isoform X2 [Macrosteles quadrilineatus]|uniref:DENN domain-containing protein 1A-like isoform X2 n=1 Tax=Macrosteles quadrilineatus TaxID=74068 RepID=UPI0023E258FA|nr:DENN domain-containing protein 1A-like isoform X2 [Macrosteles quadrilineatus]